MEEEADNKHEPINFVPWDRSCNDYIGLTKREYAAIHIMAGFATDPNCVDPASNALAAVRWADALFAELDKDELDDE